MTRNYIFKSSNTSLYFFNKTHKSGNQLVKIFSFVLMMLFSITIQSQTTFTSVQSGNYSDPATWGTTALPSSTDNVIISTGNTVTLDAVFSINNVTISGSLECTEISTEYLISGNLIVNNGGLFKGVYFYVTSWGGYNRGIKLSVAGNITNNGRIDLSEGSGSDPEGVLYLNGSSVQSVTGLGTFGGTNFSTDNTNTGAVINQLIIDNSSISTPNIIWGFNNIKIKSTITLTNARVNLGINKMIIGNYGTAASVFPSGNGFLSGTIGRWYGAYDSFTQMYPGSEYNNINTSYPFISANSKNRTAYITRPNDTTNSAVSGELSVAYFDSNSVSNGFAFSDGSYTVTDIYEGAWEINKDANYSFPLGNHAIAFSLESAYLIKNGNSRIIKTDGTIVGTHQTGTTTPFAQRIGLNDADLSNSFLVGYNASIDTPVTSLLSGNWNSPSTWSSNSVPSCIDTVTILAGHTITINSASSVAGVNINSDGSLIHNSSSLTVGCTNNNAIFSNKGTYTINSGSLLVNGAIIHDNGSAFNQIAGDIIVDGNHNGDAATSINQTLFKIGNATLNLAGGKITVIDPPVVSASLTTSHTITSIVPCTGFFCFFPTNIFLDSIENLSVGQVITGAGIPAGTVVANINFDGSINTNPSLPATGLSLPLNSSFYNVTNSKSAFVYESNTNYTVGSGHTLQIGDGISTEKSLITTNGYSCNFRASNGVLSLNNLTINALDTTNRFVTLDNTNINSNPVIIHVQNDFTITNGKVKGSGVDAYYGGNIINNGQLYVNNNTNFGNYSDGINAPTTNPQTISGTGTFNAQSDLSLNSPANTGSVGQLNVNNTSTAGVTFLVPFSVVNSLTMTAGIIHTSPTSVLKIGTPAMFYTTFINGNFSDTCFIDGPFSKDIGSGQNANDLTNGSGFIDKFLFPAGKTSYTPIWVGITTPSGGFNSPGANIKVQAFDSNPGVESSNIANMSDIRWEVSKTDGIVIDFNIKVGDETAAENYIIVQSPSASGVYDNDFGITSTFEEGTPNMLTSTTQPIAFDSFEGFFSIARQAACSSVNPGNTLANETTVCNGKPVTLSLQNVVIGEGITYQWQSSTTGSSYTDIAGATATTSSVTPLQNTYFRCNVSCSFSSSTIASTAILISLNNTIIATTPATICLPITNAVLSATASSGDVKWYQSQIGGAALGTGNSFTTPTISSTTTFYAGTETTSSARAGLVYPETGSGTGGTNKGLVFDLSNSIILNSVKVYPQQTPGGDPPAPMTIKIFQNGVQVPGTDAVVFTPDVAADWSPTNIPQIVTLNYRLEAGNNYSLEITDGITFDNTLAYLNPFPSPFPINSGVVTINGGIDNGEIQPYNYYFFFDWDITEVCSSARLAVVATVQTPEECDLGNNPVLTSLSKVIAYPNPYSTNFKLTIQTDSVDTISVKVYDMLGRLIQNEISDFDKISQLEIGKDYPSGVYNVVVTQSNSVKTLHVIKK